MVNSVIKKIHQLKDVDRRASFYIAKELSIIRINLLWFPDQLLENAARLDSLAEHVETTFKNNDIAKSVKKDITEIASDIRAYVELNPA